mmetsp:Transcript_58888/g.121682  ORF Transcript_58888/g.121682 Transcript_58888/m.121682 type:complete len:218 (+) Transcript_58888:39-692(+)
MKRGVFFDFDSTMTTPIKLPRFHRHAVADSPEIFASMTPQEILANFGGRQRLARLGQVFEELTKMGCELFIVSIGFRDSCILPHLQAVGLEQHFKPENVFGQDSKALQERGFVKGRLIADLMSDPSRGWLPTEGLFVDDSVRHTEAAAPYCEVVRVRGNGLSFLELDAVEALARGERKPLPGRVPWQLHEDEAVKALGSSAAMPGAWYVVQAESREP